MKVLKKASLIIAFLISTVSLGTAQVANSKFNWKQASAAGYPYKYVSNDPTHSRFYTLKNGLTVILSPTPKQPRIQAYIAVKARKQNRSGQQYRFGSLSGTHAF